MAAIYGNLVMHGAVAAPGGSGEAASAGGHSRGRQRAADASRIDTNSLFITEQLNLLGIEVAFKGIVGDDHEELAGGPQARSTRVDSLVCSGGLGPTDDDVTRDVVAQVLNRPLSEDEAITARIRARFAAGACRCRRSIGVRRWCRRVHACIENPNGTAPGLWLEDGDRVVLLLPGPPRELKPMLRALVGGIARRSAPPGWALVRRVLRITGRTESHTEEAVRPLYRGWARARFRSRRRSSRRSGQIELHLSARAALAPRGGGRVWTWHAAGDRAAWHATSTAPTADPSNRSSATCSVERDAYRGGGVVYRRA